MKNESISPQFDVKTEKKKELSVFEKYKLHYVDKIEGDSLDIDEAKSMLELISTSSEFPIVIKKREDKSQITINEIKRLKSLVEDFINKWNKVFSVNPLKKNITELVEGRLTETELKKIFISVKNIEKKYPEIQSSKLLDFINFPDFSEILEASEKLKLNWFYHRDQAKSIYTLEDIFNNSNPVILPEWEERIKQSNYVRIDTEKQKDELITILNFGIAYLDLLKKIGCNDDNYYKSFINALESKRFINLRHCSFNPLGLKSITKMDSIDILKK
jgi:hypothetical protein